MKPNDEIINSLYRDKVHELEARFPKEFYKYWKAMNNQILSVEVDALYNVLILKKESEYELTRKHEANVRRILGIDE